MQEPSYEPEVGIQRRPIRPRMRRAVLDELDKPDPIAVGGNDLMGPAGPASGNTGIGGAGRMTDTRVPNPGEAPTPVPSPVSAPSPLDFSAGSLLPILRKYQHTPEGLQKAFAENPGWGAAGAKVQGGDIFNPQTGRWLDVIRGASRGGEDWQYLDEQEGGADYDPNKGQMGGGATRGMDPIMSDIIAKIRQSILGLMGNGQQG